MFNKRFCLPIDYNPLLDFNVKPLSVLGSNHICYVLSRYKTNQEKQ